MPRHTGTVLVDTNVILECHRVGSWRALTGGYRVETVEPCVRETQVGAQRRRKEQRIGKDRLLDRLARISHTHGPQRTPRRRNLLTGMPVMRGARALIDVTACGWGHRAPAGCREKQPRPDADRADGPESA